jgi:hypothetical protein
MSGLVMVEDLCHSFGIGIGIIIIIIKIKIQNKGR